MNSYMTAEDASAGLRQYLREIASVPLLTPCEEIAIAKQIKKGDEEARTRMIRANLRLVVKIALNYTNFGLPLLDLIEEGNIGLMKAVERFDPAKGAKLSTYAIWWIKQAIKSALHDQAKIIRLPRHSAIKLSKMQSISLQMSEALGREPTEDELSEELGLDSRSIAELKSAGMRPSSLDAPIANEAEDEIAELVPDDHEQSPFESLRDKDLREKVSSAFSILNERERKIIFARFGLDGDEPTTLDDLGETLGITRERTRQLQNAALAKLRRMLTQDESLLPPPVPAAA